MGYRLAGSQLMMWVARKGNLVAHQYCMFILIMSWRGGGCSGGGHSVPKFQCSLWARAGVTGGDTDSLQGSDSRPLARQGTVAAALRLNARRREL